jgi:hypothetical protein
MFRVAYILGEGTVQKSSKPCEIKDRGDLIQFWALFLIFLKRGDCKIAYLIYVFLTY